MSTTNYLAACRSFLISVLLFANLSSAQTIGKLNTEEKNNKQPVSNRLVTVGAPKVYDDFYLRGLLMSLQSQLAAVSGIDQATLLSHIGVVQGADIRQSSGAISVSGPPTPSLSTFAADPNASDKQLAASTTPGTTSATSSVTPSAATPPAPTLTPPSVSSLGYSSLAAYNESLQLSASITNTALLVNGALNDALQSKNGKPKTTITLGFPITVKAPLNSEKQWAGAVAEIMVTFCSDSGEEPPSVMTLLPRERTYNVASLVDKSFLASGSAVLGGVLNIGGGWFWAHKRYYLVQQQETVAFLTDPDKLPQACIVGEAKQWRSTSFAWQIRPVLGNDFLRPGNSVNFVQFSIPKLPSTDAATTPVGRACVTVNWRKPATNWIGKRNDTYLDDEEQNGKTQCYPVNYYNTLGSAGNSSMYLTDNGQGIVSVSATGTFLPGTTVRVGSTNLVPDRIAGTKDQLRFTTSANALAAAGNAYLVSRDGLERQIIHQEPVKHSLKMDKPDIAPYSDSQSLITLKFTIPVSKGQTAAEAICASTGATNWSQDPWVAVIGGKVLGLSDAPFLSCQDLSGADKGKSEIRFVVPTSLVQSAPRLELKKLLWGAGWSDAATIPAENFAKGAPSVSKVTVLSARDGLTLALLGTRLDQLKLVFPDPCPGCMPKPADKSARLSTYLRIQLKKPTADEAKLKPPPPDLTDGLKQLVFCVDPTSADKCDEKFSMVVVDVPKVETPAEKQGIKKPDSISVKDSKLTLTGNLLNKVVLLEYGKTILPFKVVPGDGSPALDVDLKDLAGKPGTYTLLATFEDKTVMAQQFTIDKPKP